MKTTLFFVLRIVRVLHAQSFKSMQIKLKHTFVEHIKMKKHNYSIYMSIYSFEAICHAFTYLYLWKAECHVWCYSATRKRGYSTNVLWSIQGGLCVL